MAVVKKTYSRRDNELSNLSEREKENLDPFDELLSSPLKQEVQFKPLSFWGRNTQIVERQKKSKNVKYGLYETSDPDDNSPNNRKKKSKLKYSKCKGRTLPVKNRSDKNNNLFSIGSLAKRGKSTRATVPHEFGVSLPSEKIEEHKKKSSEDGPYFNKSPKFQSPGGNGCGFECVTMRKQDGKGSLANEPAKGSKMFSLKTKKNLKEIPNGPQMEFEKSLSSMKFKIYEDVASAEGMLGNYFINENIICKEDEESENLTLNFNESMEETLMNFHKCYEYCKFISVKRHYSNFDKGSENLTVTSDLGKIEGNHECLSWLQNTSKEDERPQNLTFTLYKETDISYENLENTTTYDDEEDEKKGLRSSGLSFNGNSNKTNSLLNLMEFLEDSDNTLTYNDEDSMSNTLCVGKVKKKTVPPTNDSVFSEGTQTLSVMEFQYENTALDESENVFSTHTKVEDFIQELLKDQNGSSVVALDESSLVSDENTSYVTDEESVIRVALQDDASEAPTEGESETFREKSEAFVELLFSLLLQAEGRLRTRTSRDDINDVRELDSFSGEVEDLTNEVSNMTITQADEYTEDDEKSKTFENDANFKDAKDNSVLIDLRNVTTKRKYRLSERFQRGISEADESPSRIDPFEETEMGSDPKKEWELEERVEESGVPDKSGFDWNRTTCFANPIFESTRVTETSSADAGKFAKPFSQSEKMGSFLEESQSWQDHSYALKPGKKWLRAVSILKQIRTGSVTGDRFDGSRVKGRKFESFVRDMLEMQNGKYGWSASLGDLNKSNDFSDESGLRTPLSQSVSIRNGGFGSKSSLEDVTLNSSIFSASCSDRTVLETSLINPIIKVIHPEEGPSVLGLEISNLKLEDRDSIKDENSSISARDFILLQCGQEDVLPFEEYFNESTLKNCVKIGEGVYGEVFKSSDAVIKIIPIEGADKVNGEPQKKFEEILSEVVIALKLSNLRNGEVNRTDGFCEMKRCWCVKGKYPEYLLRLWDEYDQSGTGSENDSPIMFKSDQLYIILELANGGKDLESFVFTSFAQSLSIFIQTALSLAAAEKALEFEHRDLHWGNVLISQTKEKFVTIILDNVEFKIPSKGVKVCIIDFTLSRIYHEGFCIFNDLSVDPSLFQSEGDYQFEIYKMMLREVRNDWSLFRPKTNIFWLHYTLDKMIHMVRYKNKKAKLHKKYEKDLRDLEPTVLDYSDSVGFVMSDSLGELIKKL